MIDTADRIAGSLYGLLTGDAFGCPVEGFSPEKIRARYGALTEMEEGSEGRWRPRGLHSDDGQQAMALCDALLLDPDAPAPHFARTLVHLYGTAQRGAGLFGAHRGTGRNFRGTVKALAGGAGVYDAAQPSAGNGVAMMIAPVAWYFRDEPDAVLRAKVLEVARVKQRDVRGLAAGGAVAYLVARALRADDPAQLDRAALLEFVRALERDAAALLGAPANALFSQALGDALAHERDGRDAVLARIAANANASSELPCRPGSGYALASVVTAIWGALQARGFEQAVVEVVAIGGDADTTGAIAGAIAGALHGARAIPPRWLHALPARGAFDDRVEALVARSRGWRPARPLLELERAWSAALVGR